MRAEKFTIRYLGFEPLPRGGRRLSFSVTGQDTNLRTIFVDVGSALFSGPGQMAIQECAGVCYETIRSAGETIESLPARLNLSEANVTDYREAHKGLGVMRIRNH